MKRRLRVIDFSCPLFWFLVFWRKQYGEPWLQVSLWRGKRWWFNFWMWEDEPDMRPMEANWEPDGTYEEDDATP